MFRNPLVDGLVLLIVVLLIFGPKRLPELGRGLGSGLREFKDSITGNSKADEEAADRPALGRAPEPVSAASDSAEAPHDVPSHRAPAESGRERS